MKHYKIQASLPGEQPVILPLSARSKLHAARLLRTMISVPTGATLQIEFI